MIELTGVGGALRGMSLLYWLLAIASLVLIAWKVKRWAYKTIAIAVTVAIFGYLPVQASMEARERETYAREAWAYFKKLCDEKSGEKIYKTFADVRSVLIVKPLPPASDEDHFDQFWYGDPYSASATSMRVDNAAGTLVYPEAPISMQQHGKGFNFVESYSSDDKNGEKKPIKYFFDPIARGYKTEPITRPISRFGISWEDISTAEDRRFWVAGSRLSIVDLSDNSLIAERIGYFIEAGFGSTAGQRRPWLSSRGPNTTCPPIRSSDYEDRFFILKVLVPAKDDRNGK